VTAKFIIFKIPTAILVNMIAVVQLPKNGGKATGLPMRQQKKWPLDGFQ